MSRCGAALLRAVAVSLNLAPDFFAWHYGLPLQRTQAIFCPPQAPDDQEGFGVAPHTDFAAPIDPRVLGADEPLYEPTTCGAHILGRFAAAFAYRKA